MDDDLDELLDEVEKKFCRNISVSLASPMKDGKCGKDSGERRNVGCGQKKNSITEDIDALLEELQEEDLSHAPQDKIAPPPKRNRDDQIHSQPGGRKCCPIYLGGSAVAKGVGTAASKRSCDQLRCTSCDFRVLTFDNCEWDSSCDYLFFRNNMPDCRKLGAKLRKRRGFRAYACQCSWFTASEVTDVLLKPHLRWVCARHPD
ncbi:cilia- and flagella-associated protein 418 [Hippocampus comes]|uniref:Cilia- and flagella-associated protein 418 n=1 Tax=Hippocampus comes TaxID=109280 RepID=A0A3Q2XJE6_HIPCM|nr:PREDICTED: protein C8orf37 homolog [Hippocampus comes]